MTRILIIFILIPILTNAQHTIIGKVVNMESKKPISYATISLVGTNQGTTANFEGDFKLKIRDTTVIYNLEISALGYHKRQINTKNLSKIIPLKRQIHEMPVVTVQGQKTKTKKIGVNLFSPQTSSFGTCASSNFQAALYIPNKYQIEGWVKSISYYITKDRGIPNTPFRVNIFDKNDTLKQPGKDILNRSIIISGDKNGGWVTVDIDSLYIPFIKNGIFVGMEWLYNSTNYHYTSTNKGGNYDCFGQCISITPNISEHRTWIRGLYKSTKWRLRDWWYSDPTRKKRPTNIMIRVEVEYNKSLLSDKKQKLNFR